ncbi:MAG TPA: phosphoadenylyl-sulfate reductase [Phycisphaerae bacterium]|nr:phosphoadenylyl-sulfate reductase [Phycisphaerae bacterium]HRY70258.1 phosphoadenylyl-sulfate reductase [Phycisphaerae bacterium]HSA27571.1 phosphoadenylyl-sulfate reductase [Phycisphaerae bacterium]
MNPDHPVDLDSLNRQLGTRTALEIIDWAVGQYGDNLAVSSSFGADSTVMLHLATRVKPDIKIITVDTGFLFPETVLFRDELARRLSLNLHIYRPALTATDFLIEHGRMWRSNPDACCAFNKREPFDRAKRELKLAAWITGIRRDQSLSRRTTPIIQGDHIGLVKLCPIAGWTGGDIHYYLLENDLPYHPLREHGYPSIGCRPEAGFCTSQVGPGENPRSGRWVGFDKTECGLHVHDQGSGI